jgi:hypothetical protein
MKQFIKAVADTGLGGLHKIHPYTEAQFSAFGQTYTVHTTVGIGNVNAFETFLRRRRSLAQRCPYGHRNGDPSRFDESTDKRPAARVLAAPLLHQRPATPIDPRSEALYALSVAYRARSDDSRRSDPRTRSIAFYPSTSSIAFHPCTVCTGFRVLAPARMSLGTATTAA